MLLFVKRVPYSKRQFAYLKFRILSSILHMLLVNLIMFVSCFEICIFSFVFV